MKVQECGNDFFIEGEHEIKCADPQADMIRQQIKFQQAVGLWDKRLKDYGASTFCQPFKTIYFLDLAAQEVSEAWDLVEGGWKWHKTKPELTNRSELLMEIVDVAHFLINAYIFLGGQPEQQLVAAACGRSSERLSLPKIGLSEVWGMGQREYDGRDGGRVGQLFGFGKNAHGQVWEKAVATRLNFLRHRIQETSSSIRAGMAQMNMIIDPTKFPPGSGFVYTETFPALMGAAQAIPGVTADVFYAAFMHKNQINFDRQKGGY